MASFIKRFFSQFFLLSVAAYASIIEMPEEDPLPSDLYMIADAAHLSFQVDYLFWMAREEGLDFAVTGVRNNSPEDPEQGNFYGPDFHFDSGFKVGLGAMTPETGWRVQGIYTLFYTKASAEHVSKNSTYPTIGSLWLTGGDLSPFFYARSASGDWRLHFNAVDLDVGAPFQVSPFLSLTPHFGVKGSWQQQESHIGYSLVDNGLISDKQKIHLQQSYWGIGLRTGCDMKAYLCESFSFFGELFLSALWSGISSHRSDRSEVNTLDLLLLDSENHLHLLQPCMECSLGFIWEGSIGQDEAHIALQVSFEEQIWWSQNHFVHLFSKGDSGDLSLGGLTIQLLFDF